MYMVNDYLVRSMYRCYNLFRTRLKVCYMYTYKSINSKALEAGSSVLSVQGCELADIAIQTLAIS